MFVWDVGVRIWHIWNLEARVPMTKERFPMTKEIFKELEMFVWDIFYLGLIILLEDNTKERVPMTKAKDQMNKKEMFVWDVGVRIWHIWNLEVRVPMTKERVPMTKEIFKELEMFVWVIFYLGLIIGLEDDTKERVPLTKERVPLTKERVPMTKERVLMTKELFK